MPVTPPDDNTDRLARTGDAVTQRQRRPRRSSASPPGKPTISTARQEACPLRNIDQPFTPHITLNTPQTIHTPADAVRRRFARFLHVAELSGLIALGLATVFAMAQEVVKVVQAGTVSLTDLLLMFLYLEVLAMNVRYLRFGRLPVRFPLYIAMASLARDLILRGGSDHPDHMLMTTIGIVLLALGVLVLSFGQHRFPVEVDEAGDDTFGSR